MGQFYFGRVGQNSIGIDKKGSNDAKPQPDTKQPDTKTAAPDKTPVKEEQPKSGGQLPTFQFNPGKKKG